MEYLPKKQAATVVVYPSRSDKEYEEETQDRVVIKNVEDDEAVKIIKKALAKTARIIGQAKRIEAVRRAAKSKDEETEDNKETSDIITEGIYEGMFEVMAWPISEFDDHEAQVIAKVQNLFKLADVKMEVSDHAVRVFLTILYLFLSLPDIYRANKKQGPVV